jgi:hypothetical protein
MSSSGFGVPVLVKADGSAESLRPVPLTKQGHSTYDEVWLQRLLFAHPDALPIAEIDASFRPLIPLCMEMDTPAGSVDAVFVTPTGRLALLEAKLWRNPEARREVIGQILDYAKELPAWDYSRLDVAVRQARKRAGGDNFAGIVELVAQQTPGLVPHHFQDAVTKSLVRGDYLLLIAGDGIREGVGAIAQFLDRNEALHFTFGLVECAVYDAPGGGHYVHPRVLASTTKIVRTVVATKLSEAALSDAESTQDGDDDSRPDLAERRAQYQSFWEGVIRAVHVEAGQDLRPPARGWTQRFPMPLDAFCSVAAYLIQSHGKVAVALNFDTNHKGDWIFDQLVANKDEIHRALGFDVEWMTQTSRREDQRFVIIHESFPGDLLSDSRVGVQKWLAEHVERFISVFRPRIESIIREQG